MRALLRAASPLLGLALLPSACDQGRAASVSGEAAVSAPKALTSDYARRSGGVSAPASFADLAERADPAVVFVKTVQRGSSGQRGAGTGSGFVYDPAGLILTNNHVIEQASDIRVILGKSRELKATVIGRDPPTDIAVLKVKAGRLPYLRLGNSDASRVGDWVVAIGNPFGLSHTVTSGIISAKDRTGEDVQLGDNSGYYNFIQTDASIHPGNSGGPLLDMSGAVIGISTAIRAEADRIGFAIPINMVSEPLPRLVRDGFVKRSFMGIHVTHLQPNDAERLGLANDQDTLSGALVRKVMHDGPAEDAGLKIDDVVVDFEGQEISAPERLRWLVSLAGVGFQATLKVRRGKKLETLKVTLGELPKTPDQPPGRRFPVP